MHFYDYFSILQNFAVINSLIEVKSVKLRIKFTFIFSENDAIARSLIALIVLIKNQIGFINLNRVPPEMLFKRDSHFVALTLYLCV